MAESFGHAAVDLINERAKMIPESTLKRLMSGDQSVVDDVILGYMPLAKKIAKYFSRNHPHKSSDLYSEALLGLCKAVNKIKEGVLTTENAKAYINNTIRGHVRHYLQQDHTVHIPNWYLAENVDREEFAIPIVYTINFSNNDEENREEDEELSFDIPAPDKGDVEIVREFYMKLSNFEKMVLKLRSEGYTLEEIGDQLGKSHVWISKVLNRIQDRMIQEKIEHGR